MRKLTAFDASNTTVRIKTADRDQGVSFYALDSYATNYPRVSGLELCTTNESRALIERPYNSAPQAVGAVYDRPAFFVQSRGLARLQAIEKKLLVLTDQFMRTTPK